MYSMPRKKNNNSIGTFIIYLDGPKTQPQKKIFYDNHIITVECFDQVYYSGLLNNR